MNKLIGDKKFYKMMLAIAVPIMIQNGITNFVSLLDNIMVGRIGTEQMSGVAIVNQLMFVYNICIFGAISGAGIFGAQFYGKGDHDGIRHVFRFKILISLVLCILGMAVFLSGGTLLISQFLHEGSDTGDIALALQYGRQYLTIMMIGMIPFSITQIYSSTLRETGETMMPMVSSLAAVAVNMSLNWVLIFGMLGAPRLGVQGAAIATVISRFVESVIIIAWTHRHKARNPYITGVYRSMRIPGYLVRQIMIKGTPLLLNEALWSGGMAMLTQCYSVRGLAVVAGLNISNTIANVFNVVFIAMGNAIAIIVGQLLGAGKMKEAKETDAKLIFFSVASCLCVGVVMAFIAPLFPQIYNTTDEVRELARQFIVIAALCMPLYAFANSTYFTLRAGGKTVITFLFDSVFIWAVNIPMVFVLAHYTGVNIVYVYLACQLLDLVKCIIGFFLVKNGVWLQNIVEQESGKSPQLQA